MDESKKKTKKVICPVCKGNGYIRVPYRLAKEEVTAQCGVCESEGEIDADQRDDLYVDADGIHRLQ
jgi:DnaJ-class molecular chaperone